jgi:hypothetical protein
MLRQFVALNEYIGGRAHSDAHVQWAATPQRDRISGAIAWLIAGSLVSRRTARSLPAIRAHCRFRRTLRVQSCARRSILLQVWPVPGERNDTARKPGAQCEQLTACAGASAAHELEARRGVTPAQPVLYPSA